MNRIATLGSPDKRTEYNGQVREHCSLQMNQHQDLDLHRFVDLGKSLHFYVNLVCVYLIYKGLILKGLAKIIH